MENIAGHRSAAPLSDALNKLLSDIVAASEAKTVVDKHAAQGKPHQNFIIGSGMGGGMLARRLVHNEQKFFLFEKGLAGFRTHCLNVPRQHFNHKSNDRPGRDNELYFQKHRKPYNTKEDDSPCAGGNLYGVGGRSNAWSLEAPRIGKDRASKYFPEAVINRLYGTLQITGSDGEGSEEEIDVATSAAYDQASRILTNSPPGNPAYPAGVVASRTVIDKTSKGLNDAVKKFQLDGFSPSPNGAEFEDGTGLYYSAQHAYSAADWLLDYKYNHSHDKHEHSVVGIGLEVLNLKIESNKVTGIKIRDVKNEETTMTVNKTAQVILCAGTVNSAALAKASNLPENMTASGLQGGNLIGKGLTDHEIYMAKYWKGYDKNEKPLEMSCHVTVHGHEALLTVCTQAQRFYAHEFATGDGQTDGSTSDYSVLNIMFEFKAELNEQGTVSLPAEDPHIQIKREKLDTDKSFTDQLQKITRSIRKKFGYDRTNDDNPILQEFGAVAHEVGTMRMNSSGAHGVVDENLKVHGIDNLYVCDLSIFPWSPMANPSLTLTALAIGLAEHLAEK